MATETFQKDLNSVKSDLGSLKKDVGQLFESALGKGTDAANSTYEAVKTSGLKAVESCKQGIEKHPLASVLVALGTGFIAGKIIASRNGHNGSK